MRILFLTHRLPCAPDRGDRIRAYHMLRVLAREHRVDLLSLVHDREEESKARDLQHLNSVHAARVHRWSNWVTAVTALPGKTPLTHVLLHSPHVRPYLRSYMRRHGAPDLVFAYCSGMAPYAMESPLTDVPCVLDLVDVDSLKWKALGEQHGGVRGWIYRREARRLGLFERYAATRAAAVLVVSDRERRAAERLLPRTRVLTVQNGVVVAYFEPVTPPAATHDVIFSGVFDYEPNELGAIWLATTVWPRVRRAFPDARLKLVGMRPSRRVRALAVDGSIEVTGAVADTRPHLWGAAVAAAPITIARGTQNKVLEAVAAGLPCVVTPQVLEGIPEALRPACRVAADAADFADALVRRLSAAPAARRAMAARADLSELSWDTRLRPLLGLFERLAAQRRPHGVRVTNLSFS